MRLRLPAFIILFVLAVSSVFAQNSYTPVAYNFPSTHPLVLTSEPTVPTVECYSIGSQNNITRYSIAASYDTDECRRLEDLAGRLEGPGTFQEAYDTMRAYLTLCHDIVHSEGHFSSCDADNQGRSNDPNRFVEYREWLKSVLYLRQDSEWYCADVASIGSTMTYFPGHGVYENGEIAIANYLLEHNRCDSSYWLAERHGDSASRYLAWYDTTARRGRDTSLYPRDTTIPTLEDLQLEILRGKPASIRTQSNPIFGDDEFSDIHVTEDPFVRSSSIEFQLNDYGLVTFEVFDALGRLQFTNGIGQVLSPGRHSFDIDGSKLASGVYFARLSYHGGAVKSVMLRKE